MKGNEKDRVGRSVDPAREDFLEDDGDLQVLAAQVGRLPDADPPHDLKARIMATLPDRRPSPWRRMVRWARRPYTVSISPLRAAPLLAVLALLFLLTPYFTGPGPTPVPETAGKNQLRTIVFTLDATTAESVQVIGSFNLWDPHGYDMKKDEKTGEWTLSMELPAGRHEYAFLINGEKIVPDPKAEFLADDGFGGKNSLLLIENEWAI